MKYDPEMECKVFLAVKELGEATTDEVLEYLTENEKVEIERKVLIRYLRRWKAKKVLAGNYHANKLLWKPADIPPWYVSGIMAIVKGTVNVDMRDALDGLNERLKKAGRIIEPRGVWGDYHRVGITFETVDPILGGWLSQTDGELVIPNRSGKRFIPANWFKGWLGSNAALANLPQSIRFHVGLQNAELPEFKPQTYRLKVKMGLCSYEAIPPKTQVKTIWTLPLRGSRLKTFDDWRKFLKQATEFPLRGLGANPYALGGRIKLVEMKEI